MTELLPEPDASPASTPATRLRARVDLPRQASSCTTARRTVQLLLGTWDVVDEDRVHDVLVVVSELVGNAVRHGEVQVELELVLEDGVLVVAVTDGAAGLPQQRTDGEAEECGRGLAIVGALALDWGVLELPVGKRVWARVRVSSPTAP